MNTIIESIYYNWKTTNLRLKENIRIEKEYKILVRTFHKEEREVIENYINEMCKQSFTGGYQTALRNAR